jgi:hypothetical protein
VIADLMRFVWYATLAYRLGWLAHLLWCPCFSRDAGVDLSQLKMMEWSDHNMSSPMIAFICGA